MRRIARASCEQHACAVEHALLGEDADLTDEEVARRRDRGWRL
jgi:hypothetical protein